MDAAILSFRDELRRVARDANGDTAAVEKFLDQKMEELDPMQREFYLNRLEELSSEASGPDSNHSEYGPKSELARFARLILGEKAIAQGIDEDVLEERLSAALTDIFYGINRLFRAIDSTLGREVPLDKTIRSMVGGQLGEDTEQPLSEVIDRVRQSFLLSYEAGKKSHKAVMEKVLQELAPDRILGESGGSLKLGPLRKADAFERYSQIYKSLQEWHRSERGLDEYLAQFEEYCNRATHKSEEG